MFASRILGAGKVNVGEKIHLLCKSCEKISDEEEKMVQEGGNGNFYKEICADLLKSS